MSKKVRKPYTRKANSVPVLHADIRGSGQTVVLLHGIFSSSRYWSRVQQLLEQDYKVIAIDLLGFGNSPKPRRSKYDYAEHIAAINQTLKQYNVSEPFILIGHSMGALIALRYSIIHEARVAKLVLSNMPIMLGMGEVKREILGTSRLHRLGLSRGINRMTWITVRNLYRLRMLPRAARKRLTENDYFFQHSAASRMGSFYNVIARARVDIDLMRVGVKTMMLSGIEDRKIYLDNLAAKINLRSNIQHSTVPTGHHIPCQFPELIVAQVKSHN